MDTALLAELQKVITGDITTSPARLQEYSHDASLFEVTPQVIVSPKDEQDLQGLVSFVSNHKKDHPNLSLTARAAGTDMSGGPLNDSIIVSFGPYFNATPQVRGKIATTQPGVFYRDFEKETLKRDLIFPSYPASREICAMGGIVSNNAGGEKSLEYGKTDKYVKRMSVVFSDGNTYECAPLRETQLNEKLKQKDFEGTIYRKLFTLIKDNHALILKAKPAVSKNSAGYNLWDVWDKEKGTFDLTKLFVGSQGTLGMMTEFDIELVPVHAHRKMMVIFLYDLSHLGDIITHVLPLNPESFECYDDNTLRLALKYFPEFAKLLGTKGLLSTAFEFAPEFLMSWFGRMPKLILQVDFTANDPKVLDTKIKALQDRLAPLHPHTRIADEAQEKKYWAIRRESYNLLRQKIHNKHPAPFIEDFVVAPKYLPEFLPKLQEILATYPRLIYTIAGHVGDGNFHIIPLMNMNKKRDRDVITNLSKEVNDLVFHYQGSITGEHNDGLIRTPYLEQMYGKKLVALFEEVKDIFDPQGIFNPRKKVHGSLSYAMDHIRTHWK